MHTFSGAAYPPGRPPIRPRDRADVPDREFAIRLRRRLLALAAVVLAPNLAGCGSSSGPTSSPRDAALPTTVPSSVTVTTARVGGLGTVLVDGTGRTLYMFPPDAGSRVSCTGACAGVWPPLVVANGHTPHPGAGVDSKDLGTLHDPNTGARVVTYAGHPLYRYSGDVAAGQANGQALFNSGGPWYAMDAAGRPVTTEPKESR